MSQQKIFVTSDTHFGHRKVMQFCAASRQFDSVEHMNQQMILEWNSRVGPSDIVYHLGDFAYCTKKQTMREIFAQLNGDKILIVGNHDHSDTMKLPWVSISYYLEIERDDQKYVMMHYPIEDWNHRNNGSIHLHGHVHTMPPHPDHPTRLPVKPNRFDVGVDRMWIDQYHGPIPLEFFGGMKTEIANSR